jgi:hypothetical protein
MGERTAAAIGLILAAIGLLNLTIWKISLAGLDAKQIAIVSFLPSVFIVYYVFNSPRPGALNE